MLRKLLTAITLTLTVALAAAVLPALATPAEASAPRLLVYGTHDRGVTIQRAANVRKKLHGAPVGFRKFVRRTIHHLQATSPCDDSFVGVTVNRVRTDGFARGGVNQCGGYVAIWKKVDGHWRQVLGTQDVWACSDLRRWGIPSSVVGPRPQCYDGSDVVAYSHA
jgi:hypothetical protein